MEDIILIDKPKGITSFDVIRKLRKKLGIKKMGHAGTLDPLATGLMLIGVEKGTKKLAALIGLPKTYRAEILVGVRTTTGDLEGNAVAQAIVPELGDETITAMLAGMKGPIKLPVPAYSAIKLKGKKLYELARKNIPVDLPEKEMEITGIRLLGHHHENDRHIISVEMDVKSGTYVRSLAEEIGKRLGYPATLKELRRTRIGDFSIEQAQELD